MTAPSPADNEHDVDAMLFLHEIPSLCGPPEGDPGLPAEVRRALDERLREYAARRWESR